MPIKQSVCLPILPQGFMPQEELLREIAAIGYSAIEIWGRGDDFDALCESAARHGLQVVSMVGHNSLPDGLNNPKNHDRIEAELIESIDIAAAKGLMGIICFSGNWIDGVSDEEGIANCALGLQRVAPYAESCGIKLNLELLNSKVDHAGYQCDSTAWGQQVVDQMGSPNVKLLYDIYHMQIMEGDIIRTMTNHIGAIGHIHTAGNPGRNDLDNEQELNYGAICRALAKTEYSGYVGHEFVPKGDPIAALRQAFELCNVE